MHHLHLTNAIGGTPLIELKHCSPKPRVRIYAKFEGWNPTGSVKDRIVRRILAVAREEGRIAPGDTVIEASTGNTGIALAMVGRALGYNVRVVMPQNAYPAIAPAISVYGAPIEWVTAEQGIRGAIEVARTRATEQGWFFLNQFADPQNATAHYETTGREILEDLLRVDVLVAGVGTGGTLMGAGRRLREANPNTKLIAAEPHPGHLVQGLKSLADGFIPPMLDLDLLDGKILVRSSQAFRATAELMKRDGIFAGVSSGAVLYAALTYIQRLEQANVVLIFADNGWKYLDTNLWTAQYESDREELDETIWW